MITEKPRYRNAVRSKMLIQDAFMQLMVKYDLEKIKAKDIIELANISKGTFYAHYNSVFDLLKELEDEYLSMLFLVFKDHPNGVILEDFLPLFLSGLREIDKERAFFLVLFKSSHADAFLNRVRQTFISYMFTNYRYINKFKSECDAEMFFTYVAGGTLTLIKEWITTEDRAPSDDIAISLNKFILQGIGAVMKTDSHIKGDNNTDRKDFHHA